MDLKKNTLVVYAGQNDPSTEKQQIIYCCWSLGVMSTTYTTNIFLLFSPLSLFFPLIFLSIFLSLSNTNCVSLSIYDNLTLLLSWLLIDMKRKHELSKGRCFALCQMWKRQTKDEWLCVVTPCATPAREPSASTTIFLCLYLPHPDWSTASPSPPFWAWPPQWTCPYNNNNTRIWEMSMMPFEVWSYILKKNFLKCRSHAFEVMVL